VQSVGAVLVHEILFIFFQRPFFMFCISLHFCLTRARAYIGAISGFLRFLRILALFICTPQNSFLCSHFLELSQLQIKQYWLWHFGRRGVPLHLSGFPCQYHRRVVATKLTTSKCRANCVKNSMIYLNCKFFFVCSRRLKIIPLPRFRYPAPIGFQ